MLKPKHVEHSGQPSSLDQQKRSRGETRADQQEIDCAYCEVSDAEIKRTVRDALRKVKHSITIDPDTWFHILRNGGCELTIRSRLLSAITIKSNRTISIAEKYYRPVGRANAAKAKGAKKLDLVSFCRECKRPILALELKSNFAKQIRCISKEKEKAGKTLKAINIINGPWKNTFRAYIHFVVRLRAPQIGPDSAFSDVHNELVGDNSYKIFQCEPRPPKGLPKELFQKIALDPKDNDLPTEYVSCSPRSKKDALAFAELWMIWQVLPVEATRR